MGLRCNFVTFNLHVLSSPILRRRLLICVGAIAISFVIAALAGTVFFFSPLLTHYIEGDGFRVAMENETAKGLHFSSGRYAPIRRSDSLTAQSESFQASNGKKAVKSLDVHGISARFDPWGLFVRQLRFSDVHVRSGDVEIQVYEANPEAIEPKPWFAIFLPKRVYVKKIESEQANVTWRFRGNRAGFFGTQLLITPNGPDFEYLATGGRLKMALLPELDLRRAHLLITKTLLTIYDVDLASNSDSGERIHAQANAGIGKDKGIDFKARLDRVPIRTWLPVKWKRHLSGSAFGNVIGQERIQSWKVRLAKARSAWTMRESTTFPLWKSSRNSLGRNHSSLLSLLIVRSVLRGAIRRWTSRTSRSNRKGNS